MADVDKISLAVQTSGQDRTDHTTAVRIAHEIPSTGSSGHVGAAGGLLSSSATIAAVDPADVSASKVSPWARVNNWPPAEGDVTSVDASLNGETPARRFTGRLESVEGGALAPGVDLEAVSSVDAMHREFTHEPLARVMPVHYPGDTGFTPRRLVETWLRTEHFIDVAMRRGGFYTTPRGIAGPPPAGQTSEGALVVPFQGSTWPTHGRLVECAPGQAGHWSVNNEGRLALVGVNAAWAVHKMDNSPSGNVPTNRMNLAVLLRYGGTGYASGDGVMIDLMVSPTIRTARLFITASLSQIRIRVAWGNSASPTYVIDHSVPLTAGYTESPIRLRRLGDDIRIYSGDQLLFSTTTTGLGTNPITMVRMTKQGTTGLGVWSLYLGDHHVENELTYTDPATAFIRAGTLFANKLEATPYISGSALGLLQEITEALFATLWFDNEDRLWWAHSDWLTGRPPSKNITADSDLLDMAWDRSMDDTARQVVIKHRQPSVTTAVYPTVPLMEGQVRTLATPGEVMEVWAKPDPDTTWIEPSTNFNPAGGWGSVARSVLVDLDADTEQVVVGTGSPGWSIQQINSQTLLVKYVAPSSFGTFDEVQTRQPENGWTTTTKWQASQGMPILRGWGSIDWADNECRSAASGPSWAREITHHAGPWVQGTQCQAMADWLMGLLATPRPVIQALPIAYRTDIKLGDSVRVLDTEVYDVEVRAVVIGVREAHVVDADGATDSTMELRLRVINAF